MHICYFRVFIFLINFFQQSGCTSQAQMCYSNSKARWSKEMLVMFEGFVLQGLVTPLLSKVVHPNKNNIHMSQMYIIAQRGRIVATILPFFPFWDSFFFHFSFKTPSGMTGKPYHTPAFCLPRLLACQVTNR